MSIQFLRRHAQTLSEFAHATAERAAKSPDDPWLSMAADNQRQAASDAVQALAIAQSGEAGELMDLRFIGPTANGSIPLDAFLKIAEPLSRAWKAAAYRIRHGLTDGRAGKEIADALNLRLAGVAGGSTRIFITGNGSSDLTGESLLQSTWQQTFRLLTARNEEFYDAVDAIGGKAAHYLGDAMAEIHAAGLSAEFTWHTPAGQMTWEGTSDDLVRIRTLIAAASEPVVYQETIAGNVAGITDTGKLELRTMEGRVPVRFPLDLTEKVQQLSIAKRASLRVNTTKYWDAVAKKDIFKRLLLDVEGQH